ncbi:hypothetical protein ANANG_G00311260 [Anguilla anguilla]|uniref:Uncharacterized protein n=1 Tax=Anguilla anguilla TaxID=7936 RepID=A0A9D3LIA2_ANGAN|nr:hypothetical protein ANANG_G00311260 [Anguilla anguilla]
MWRKFETCECSPQLQRLRNWYRFPVRKGANSSEAGWLESFTILSAHVSALWSGKCRWGEQNGCFIRACLQKQEVPKWRHC